MGQTAQPSAAAYLLLSLPSGGVRNRTRIVLGFSIAAASFHDVHPNGVQRSRTRLIFLLCTNAF
jgi:hypothetical protein